MKISKYHELFENDIVYPDMKVLQLMYGNELPSADPHTLRMRYMADVRSGKVKTGDIKEPAVSSTKMDSTNDLKKDVAFKISEILGATLNKEDKIDFNGVERIKDDIGQEFLSLINDLILKYEKLIPKVNPNAKVIDIDEPFKDEQGKIKKFRDPVKEEPSYIPKGALGDVTGFGLGSSTSRNPHTPTSYSD